MRLKWLGIHVLRVMQHEYGDGGVVPRSHRNVACRVLGEEEVLAFAVDPALELDEQWVRSAFARGALCLGAVENGRLLGYTWLGFRDTPCAAGVWIALDASLRYAHRSFVRPGYRRQRIVQALRALAERPEQWRGRRASVSVDEARPGASTLGYAACATIFGILIALRSPGLRRAGIRFYAPPPARIADRMQAWPDRSPHSSA
ncbi:MAG TPA: hypothetical protein VFZ81_08725 [Burkholderiales bacterium]